MEVTKVILKDRKTGEPLMPVTDNSCIENGRIILDKATWYKLPNLYELIENALQKGIPISFRHITADSGTFFTIVSGVIVNNTITLMGMYYFPVSPLRDVWVAIVTIPKEGEPTVSEKHFREAVNITASDPGVTEGPE